MTKQIEKNELAREEIYSPEKVAEILDVKKAFVMRLLRSGELKGSKMGKFWRVTESALTPAPRGAARAWYPWRCETRLSFTPP